MKSDQRAFNRALPQCSWFPVDASQYGWGKTDSRATNKASGCTYLITTYTVEVKRGAVESVQKSRGCCPSEAGKQCGYVSSSLQETGTEPARRTIEAVVYNAKPRGFRNCALILTDTSPKTETGRGDDATAGLLINPRDALEAPQRL
jgi:hypothetical protein